MVDTSSPQLTRAISEVVEQVSRLPLTVVSQEEVKGFLKSLDMKAGILRQASDLLERGKKLHVGLKLSEAAELYARAAKVLEKGFVRFYDTRIWAEPYIQMGVALCQARQFVKAEQAFKTVLEVLPDLELSEGYYSPSVRRFFKKVKAGQGSARASEPKSFDSAEIQRLVKAGALDGLLVFTSEHIGEQEVLKAAFFDSGRKAFTCFESMVVDAGSPEELVRRLQPALMEGLGIKALPEKGGKEVSGGPGKEEEPKEPWYERHWWIWPVSAVVLGGIAAAVVLPLTVYREDVVDVRIHF